MTGRPRVDMASRFWSRVRKSDGCWEWTGALELNGYARIRRPGGGANIGAHRFAWELQRGPVPAGLCVCHHCDNRRCVRLDHLFLGTHADNQRDKTEKGRQARGQTHGSVAKPWATPFGAIHGRAKLGAKDVAAIRRRWSLGESLPVLSKAFGISQAQVYRISTHQQWRHLP